MSASGVDVRLWLLVALLRFVIQDGDSRLGLVLIRSARSTLFQAAQHGFCVSPFEIHDGLTETRQL